MGFVGLSSYLFLDCQIKNPTRFSHCNTVCSHCIYRTSLTKHTIAVYSVMHLNHIWPALSWPSPLYPHLSSLQPLTSHAFNPSPPHLLTPSSLSPHILHSLISHPLNPSPFIPSPSHPSSPHLLTPSSLTPSPLTPHSLISHPLTPHPSSPHPSPLIPSPPHPLISHPLTPHSSPLTPHPLPPGPPPPPPAGVQQALVLARWELHHPTLPSRSRLPVHSDLWRGWGASKCTSWCSN